MLARLGYAQLTVRLGIADPHLEATPHTHGVPAAKRSPFLDDPHARPTAFPIIGHRAAPTRVVDDVMAAAHGRTQADGEWLAAREGRFADDGRVDAGLLNHIGGRGWWPLLRGSVAASRTGVWEDRWPACSTRSRWWRS